MVVGLDAFKQYFGAYTAHYIIIGGTACDLIIGEAGFRPRATKDMDIILVVEALDAAFVKQFWLFIKDGNYEHKEKSDDKRQYYRFTKPEIHSFPYQIELFARKPDILQFDEHAHLTPIPVDDGLSSLSAILLNDDYYNYILKESVVLNDIKHAQSHALICLKAKAYIEIAERINNGSKEDKKHLNKHKGDVFRLMTLMLPDDVYELPESIKTDMQFFVVSIVNQWPGKEIFIEMGLRNISSEDIYNQLIKSFKLIKKTW